MAKFLKKFGKGFELDTFSDDASRLLQGADATKCGARPLEDSRDYLYQYDSYYYYSIITTITISTTITIITITTNYYSSYY